MSSARHRLVVFIRGRLRHPDACSEASDTAQRYRDGSMLEHTVDVVGTRNNKKRCKNKHQWFSTPQ